MMEAQLSPEQAPAHDLTIRRFKTAEELRSAFVEEAGILLPQMFAGPKAFFSEFGPWFRSYGSRRQLAPYLCAIPPDPTLGLSYPYPCDELAIALDSVSGSADDVQTIEECASRYGLPPGLLNRPTTALSGGERLLLNFAKAHILSCKVSKLVLCSPFQWLHPSNFHYVDRLLESYKGTPVSVLLLDGELFPHVPEEQSHNPDGGSGAAFTCDPVAWSLQLDSAGVEYPASRFPVECDRVLIRFRSRSTPLKLDSPTLCEGTNGIGKSSLARILSGCEPCAKGRFRLTAGAFHGKARLVMSYVADQLFSLTPVGHIDWTFRFDQLAREKAIDLFHKMEYAFAKMLSHDDSEGTIGEDPNTILQAKLALVAERLAAQSPLLILDEPGWGLSRRFASAFLRCVCREASTRQVAVMVIAHTNEAYRGFVNSRLLFAPDENDRTVVWVDDLDSIED